MTTATVAAAAPEIEQRVSGAHATVLQSKQTGVWLYERVGYRKVTRFRPTEAFRW